MINKLKTLEERTLRRQKLIEDIVPNTCSLITALMNLA